METPAVDIPGLRRRCSQCTLQQLCLAGGMSAHDLTRLDDIVRRRRPLDAGAHLFRMGEALGSVFIPRSGAIKTVTYSENGDEHIMGFHFPGELLGLDALASGQHRCDAVALATTVVCEVPFDQLGHIATQIPGLHQQLMRIIGISFDRDHDHREILVRRQANERIALFLHGISERFRGVGCDGLHIRLPMSRLDIANYLGLALETVSRGFTRLEEDGYIRVHGRQIAINDAGALARLAHGMANPSSPRARHS